MYNLAPGCRKKEIFKNKVYAVIKFLQSHRRKIPLPSPFQKHCPPPFFKLVLKNTIKF